MEWQNFWQAIGGWLANSGIDILVTLMVGGLIYYFVSPVIFWLTRRIAKGLKRKTPISEIRKRQKTLASLFSAATRVLVVAVVIFTILSDLGLNLVPLLASAGIAGVALGFGAQNLVKDTIAGFFIIVENQYRLGDYIEVTGVGLGDAYGSVEKITIRSTTLRDRDGNVHFIPNGSVTQVVNKTLGYSKVHFTFAVAVDTDTDDLIKLIDDMGQKMAKEKNWHDKIVNPPHFSEIGQIGKDGFDVTVSGITEPADQWDVSSEFRRRLIARMQRQGIKTIETVG
jgi:small conductance mechanosensitive channel